MNKEVFTEQVDRIVITNQIERPNPLTLKEYWEKFKSVSDSAFIKMVDHILEVSEYRRFPIIGDFIQARRAVLPAPNTFNPDMSNNDPESKAATRAWAREMAEKFRQKDTDKNRLPTRAEKIQSLNDHIAAGECYSVNRSEWINETEIGNDTIIWPKDELDKYKIDTDLEGMRI